MNLADVKQKFSGEVILPEDNAYEQARNALFAKGSPAIVFRPKDNDDVAAAIKYARDNSLKLSVRSGGHSGAGFSTNDGGVVIDMSLINKVELIDKEKNIVRLGGGAKWGAVAKALDAYHLAISSGDTVSVGVGGLTLGAGIGWMVRKHGLAIDNLLSAEIVTADGKTLRASLAENPDLFWALRGGGGNFGVVTYFEFAAHPVSKVYAGTIVYGLDNLPELITGWRDGMRSAPEELTTMLVTLSSFMGMPPSAIVMCCFAGDDKAAADKALEPFRHLGKVLSDDVKEKHYYEVLEEAHPPEGMYVINKNGFAQDFSDELIKVIADSYTGDTGPILQIRSLGGAMKQVPAEATAFAYRDSEVMIVTPAFVKPDAVAADKAKALETWDKIHPFTKGGYIGFFSERDEDIATMYPAAAYERLAKVKKTYDPDNIFDQNFNVKPSK
jgi:FAD/FMN-containing dehydrogenase